MRQYAIILPMESFKLRLKLHAFLVLNGEPLFSNSSAFIHKRTKPGYLSWNGTHWWSANPLGMDNRPKITIEDFLRKYDQPWFTEL